MKSRLVTGPVFLILSFLAQTSVRAATPDQLRGDEAALAVRIAEHELELTGRVFQVDTELLREKVDDGVESEHRFVQVVHYAYEGDMAILTTVDLRTREIVEIERVPHLSVPLHADEVAAAFELAFRDQQIREALGQTVERVKPEALLLRTSSTEDPLFGHRSVRIMFRLDDDYLSWPIAIVDLTEQSVQMESREPPAGSRRPDQLEMPGELPSPQPVNEALERRLSSLESAISELQAFGTCCLRHTQQAAAGEVVQEFPPNGPMETAWKVRFAHATSKGLYVTGAWFRRTPTDSWQRVLWDARLSDIFVPYHSGSPRYLDLTGFSFDLVPVQSVDLGCCGQKADDYVVKEVRDRGMLWKNDTSGRRGSALVLWATLDAANYNYIMEYSFRDDGMISFRLGATARNLPGREREAHMHNGLWRIDIDLGGFQNDTALITSHSEPPGSASASDSATPFNGGKEGSADWQSLEFTALRVVDTKLKNGHGKPIAYDLMPVRGGRPRHQEAFSEHDFWVTRYKASELYYTQLPAYVANGEPVVDTDVVLWHISPAHHLPRQEDGEFLSGIFKGSALLMWGGFDLRPRDFFDRTPLYPYP